MESCVERERLKTAWLDYVERAVKLGKWFVTRYITGRPFLMRVEYHVVDHCNLNCRGCVHFSNISPERFRDVGDFEREIACLASKIDLHELVIIGGEPLLHSDIASFLSVARRYYPRSVISLCTNCLLLGRMDDGFWNAMHENGIGIKLTVYPPMKEHFGDIIRLVRRQRVRITRIYVADRFGAGMNRRGDSDPVMTHRHCGRRICHHLRDGRLYTCPDACYMDIYNGYFNGDIPKDAGIDIYGNDGKALVEYVTTPKDMCRYCTARGRTFEWARSSKAVDEWDGNV